MLETQINLEEKTALPERIRHVVVGGSSGRFHPPQLHRSSAHRAVSAAQMATGVWPWQAAVPESRPRHRHILYVSAELGAQAGSHPASELRNWALCQGRAL